jgi:hypothetical protein
MIEEALRGCYAVQLFEARTGLSAAWLVDNVTVTPSDDPDAGPTQWAVDWHGAARDFADLQPAALAALFWQDALADAPFLTDAQRDALAARNLRDEERAKALLDRRSGADKTNSVAVQAKARAREIAVQAWKNAPNTRKPEMIYIVLKQLHKEGLGKPVESTVWEWLKGGDREPNVIPPDIQKGGRPKSKGR